MNKIKKRAFIFSIYIGDFLQGKFVLFNVFDLEKLV